MGRITNPRDLGMPCPKIEPPERQILNIEMLIAPLPLEQARQVQLIKGPNIATLPALEPLPASLKLPVLLKVGDDISTDEIMPAAARALPFRSNIPEISGFAFDVIDDSYARRRRCANAAVTQWSAATTTVRARAASRPRWRRAISGCAW